MFLLRPCRFVEAPQCWFIMESIKTFTSLVRESAVLIYFFFRSLHVDNFSFFKLLFAYSLLILFILYSYINTITRKNS